VKSASDANPHSLLARSWKTTHLLNYALLPLPLQAPAPCILIYTELWRYGS
jgi:hypothetical protein